MNEEYLHLTYTMAQHDTIVSIRWNIYADKAICYKSIPCGTPGCRISATSYLIFMCAGHTLHTQTATRLRANIIGGAMKNDVLWLIRVALPLHYQ